MLIEVRFKAINNPVMRGDCDDSQSINIDLDEITAESILNELANSGHITTYIKSNNIDSDVRKSPTLRSELTTHGEFTFTMPATSFGHDQSFKAWIVMSI